MRKKYLDALSQGEQLDVRMDNQEETNRSQAERGATP